MTRAEMFHDIKLKVHAGKSFILSQYALKHAGAVDQLGIHRAWGDEPFTRADHRLVRLLHVELGRLWRRDALRHAGGRYPYTRLNDATEPG